MAILASTQITGTLGVLGQVTVTGITASFQGTATNAISASYVPNLYPQEYLPSASWASSSISASYVPNLYPQEYLASASWASASISASYVSNLYPQEYLPSASWASASVTVIGKLTTLELAPTMSIDFNASLFHSSSITASMYLTTSNLEVGKMASLKLIASASQNWNVYYPSQWVWLGVAPTVVSASKVAVVSLTSFGTTDNDIVAAFAMQS